MRAAADVIADLEAKRDVYEKDIGEQRHFYVKVLGGEDTEARFGVAADYIGCLARGSTAMFRIFFVVQAKYTFKISRVGSEDNAYLLSLAMTETLDYFFGLWIEGGSQKREFRADEIAGVTFSQRVRDFRESLPMVCFASQKLREVFAFVPKLR